MNTRTSMVISTRIRTTTRILTRTKNTVMSILTRTIMNTRISTAMNMITKGKPMCTLMSMRASTDLTSISTPDMRKSCTSTKM